MVTLFQLFWNGLKEFSPNIKKRKKKKEKKERKKEKKIKLVIVSSNKRE